MRSLLSRPWLTAAMVVTLAVGIGASTAVYAVCNHVLLRPVPGVPASDRLVRVPVETTLPSTWPGVGTSVHRVAIAVSARHLESARAMPAFDGLAGTTSRSYAVLLQDGADPEVAGVGLVTRDFFKVLGPG